MPRKDRKRPDAFTVILVPHSQASSVSVRVPFWMIYVGVGLCLVFFVTLAYFAVDYHDTASQLAEMRRGGQVAIVRERNLGNTIASQRQEEEALREVIARQYDEAAQQAGERQEEALRFNEEVARLYSQLNAQIAELEQFKSDIRRLVGLEQARAASAPVAPAQAAAAPAPTPAPSAPSAPPPAATPAPVAQPPATAQNAPAAASSNAPAQPPATNANPAAGAVAMATSEALGERATAGALSSRGADVKSNIQTTIQATDDLLGNTVPQQIAELESLKEDVAGRVSKVDGWASPEQLSRKLDLYDASPRAWPIMGRISARFGYDSRRYSLGANPNHEGIDITAGVGAAVRSPQDGVVVSGGWDGTYGLTVQIRHDMGWATFYAHLGSVPVKVGEKVKRNQVIGYVGMTGLTTGPHLHYEIYQNGVPVDPAKYLGQ